MSRPKPPCAQPEKQAAPQQDAVADLLDDVTTTHNKLAASRKNTVLDDICGVIGLRATIMLAAWWGGRNIVVPIERPERSAIARVIGEDAAVRLSREYGGEQIFVPRMNWFETIRQARQAYNLRMTGMDVREIARLMVLTPREIDNLIETGKYALMAEVLEKKGRVSGPPPLDLLQEPKVRAGMGGDGVRRAKEPQP